MNDRKRAPGVVPSPAFALPALVLLLCGCGAGAASGLSTGGVPARLDVIDRKSAEQAEQLEEMSRRITELENLVLKQMNELKKLAAALASQPKTLSPVGADAEAPSAQWQDDPILAAGTPSEGEGEPTDDKPRPLLKLHGTPPAPETDGGGPPVKVTPASLLTDTSSVGGFVPLKLPPLDETVPEVGEALEQGGGAAQPVDPYAQGVLKYESGEYKDAILYFDLYLKHDPKGSQAMNALFLKAESLYQTKSYLDAMGLFELVLQRYPGGSRAASAKLRIGRCYEKLGDDAMAASVYQALIHDFPDTSQADKAAKLLADMD
jgi:TolA-binding protein